LGQAVRLIFANRVDIRQVSLYDEEYSSVIDGLQNAIALDFHYKLQMVIWSDVTLDSIKRAHLNGSVMSDAIWWGLKSPGGVAVDWIHDVIILMTFIFILFFFITFCWDIFRCSIFTLRTAERGELK
jgi:hypothetical protein